MTSARHWPVVQRRKLEKLKDERLLEFERACLESFDWLENYYQGCVYAAQQNRDYHDQPPSRSSYGSPLSTSKLSYTTIHGADENPVTPTRTVYSSQDRDFYKADELSFLGMEAQDSPRKRTPRSKESMGQYRLKSPRIPASMALNKSPRSPFERNHYSHRRSHLRVDASAATRRARRALRALQRESIQPSSSNNASSENQLNRTDKSEKDLKAPSEKTLRSTTDPTHVLPPPPPPPPPPVTTSNTEAHMEDPSLTPMKRPRSLVQSSRTLGTHFRSRRTEEAESPGDFEPTPTPVSRARDSMTLISPVSRTPGRHLSRESTASSSYSEDPRQKSTTPAHGRERTPAVGQVDTEEDPPESKRPRVSSFLDSMAPVRFNSPVPNSVAQSGSHADKTMDPHRIRSSVGSAESKTSRQSILSREQGLEAHHLESGTTQTPRQTSSGRTAIHRSMTPVNGDKMIKSESALSNSPKGSTAAVKVGTDNQEEQTLQTLRGSNTRADPANKSLKDTEVVHSKAASSEALTGRSVASLDTNLRSSIGYQKRNDEQSIHGDSTESESLQRTRAKLNPGRDNNANITASQSIYAPPKPRVGLTLQEKRTIGQRTKPISAISLQQLSSTQSQMPPSRLTKTLSSLSAPGTTSQDYEGRHTQSSMATNQKIGTTSLTGDLSAASVLGLVKRNSTTHGDTIHSGYLGQSSDTAATTHQRAILLRGGLSTAKKTSESTLLRSESHGSLSRKPFISTKSAFALKRPARPVLPDGTLTSKVLASVLSASASASSSSASSSSASSKPTSILKMNGGVKSTSSLDTKGVTEAQPSKTSTGHSSKSLVEPSLSLSSSLLSSKAQSGLGSGSGSGSVSVKLSAGNDRTTLETTNQDLALSSKLVHMAPLPDIPSDNEDEDIAGHPSSQDASGPRWASWEEMEQAMHNQVHLNPSDIFGPLPALDIDEIFPVRSKPEPARARSSSAHWGVADRLTTREIIKYNEDMGWGNKDSLI